MPANTETRCRKLEQALREAIKSIASLRDWRETCLEYDADMSRPPRTFTDAEAWQLMECSAAHAAARASAALAEATEPEPAKQ